MDSLKPGTVGRIQRDHTVVTFVTPEGHLGNVYLIPSTQLGTEDERALRQLAADLGLEADVTSISYVFEPSEIRSAELRRAGLTEGEFASQKAIQAAPKEMLPMPANVTRLPLPGVEVSAAIQNYADAGLRALIQFGYERAVGVAVGTFIAAARKLNVERYDEFLRDLECTVRRLRIAREKELAEKP